MTSRAGWKGKRKEDISRYHFPDYRLDELFWENEIEDLMVRARQRIIGEFYYAKEENPRYRPGGGMRRQWPTDNYIIGSSEKLGDLARYIQRHMHRAFVTPADLPYDLRSRSSKIVERIISRAQHDLIVLELCRMRNGDIWYDESTGIWQIRQSCIDEFTSRKTQVKKASKVDDRSWHGRPSCQRGSMPEGVSVSFA